MAFLSAYRAGVVCSPQKVQWLVSSRCQLRKAARRDFRPAVRPASLGGKTTPNSSSTDTSHVSTDSSSDPKISPFVGNTALEQQLAGGMADGYVPLEQGSPSQTVDLTGAGDSVLSERINEIRETLLFAPGSTGA
mmetsp:Transcript_21631/g.51674  ORF Transcript_21631/g.51674 Transcript_21631/m.51674 type:complete len:135 (-) Transcript_21631:1346-1750(-)